jgi:hypothetical protein
MFHRRHGHASPHPASGPPSAVRRRSRTPESRTASLASSARAASGSTAATRATPARRVNTSRLKLAHHPQVVAPERSGAGHRHAQLSFACYFACLFFRPFSFHGLQAPAVERQQLVHVLLGLGPARSGKSRRRQCRSCPLPPSPPQTSTGPARYLHCAGLQVPRHSMCP